MDSFAFVLILYIKILLILITNFLVPPPPSILPLRQVPQSPHSRLHPAEK